MSFFIIKKLVCRVTDQAQREVRFGDLASLTFDQQVRITMSAM